MINKKYLLIAVLLLAVGGAYMFISWRSIPSKSVLDMPVKGIADNVSVGAPMAVEISNFAFQPAEIRIPAGTKVIWKNEDSAKHNVLADNGEFKSRLLGKDETFEYIFDQKGTFTYFCGPHPWMKAVVIVE